jgi:hypothetical protein
MCMIGCLSDPQLAHERAGELVKLAEELET